MQQHKRRNAATVLSLRLPAFAVNFATQSPASLYNVFDVATNKTGRGACLPVSFVPNSLLNKEALEPVMKILYPSSSINSLLMNIIIH